jgi:hypothetical protein
MWKKTESKKAVSGLLVKNLPALGLQGSEAETIITFPYSVLISHACDVSEFCDYVEEVKGKTQEFVDRQIITQMIFCPAFDEDQFSKGTHLNEQYKYKMPTIYENEMKKIRKNFFLRYHYLKGPVPDIPNFIIDFRHFFTLPATFILKYLADIDGERYVLDHINYTCLSDRFAHYLQRVAIPD